MRGANDDIRDKLETHQKSNHDRIEELDNQIKKLERDYEELKVNKQRVDETFEKYKEDTDEYIDKLNKEREKDKVKDSKEIQELKKQMEDANTFKDQKQEYEMKMQKLERDLE